VIINWIRGKVNQSIVKSGYYTVERLWPLTFSTVFVSTYVTSTKGLCVDIGGNSMASIYLGAYNVLTSSVTWNTYHCMSIGY